MCCLKELQGQSITNQSSRPRVMRGADYDLLNSIYTERLQELRTRAEKVGIVKSGSVEVLRARLIREEVLKELDLSWEGIQSFSHNEMGRILKVFGIKSSGSHKERRQRLWLHLNYDSRRMTIENLAEMGREELYQLCLRLELDLTGNRTVLMGRVAGVLTSQMKGWGRIKRSLRRNGIPNPLFEENIPDDDPVLREEPSPNVEIDEDLFGKPSSEAILEDASDSIVIGLDKQPTNIQGDLLTIQARVEELERMVGTILRGHEGYWGESEKDLLLRLAARRGWPIREKFVQHRLSIVATNIAETKGANMTEMGSPRGISENSESVITRIRSKLSSVRE